DGRRLFGRIDDGREHAKAAVPLAARLEEELRIADAIVRDALDLCELRVVRVVDDLAVAMAVNGELTRAEVLAHAARDRVPPLVEAGRGLDPLLGLRERLRAIVVARELEPCRVTRGPVDRTCRVEEQTVLVVLAV